MSLLMFCENVQLKWLKSDQSHLNIQYHRLQIEENAEGTRSRNGINENGVI